MLSIFKSRKNRSFVVDPAVFTCVSMLARALGPALQNDLKELLDSMLATGLRLAFSLFEGKCENKLILATGMYHEILFSLRYFGLIIII